MRLSFIFALGLSVSSCDFARVSPQGQEAKASTGGSAEPARATLPPANRRGKIKIVIDSDNTIGAPRRDIDDGLALLYLLGRTDIEVVGITTTFGNADIDTVNANTHRFLKEIGRESIPVHHGSKIGEDRKSDAARFLASAVREHPRKVTILALGSLANLAGAGQMDPAFFGNVASIVVMGGVTDPLIIGGKELSELNFAVDSEAARRVLHASTLPAVLTGNLCKNAFFGPDDFVRLAEGAKENAALRLVQRYAVPWRAWRNERQPTDGFFLWDLVPAVYLTNPELFGTSEVRLAEDQTNLDRGFIAEAPAGARGSPIIVGERILDVDALKAILFDAWSRVSLAAAAE